MSFNQGTQLIWTELKPAPARGIVDLGMVETLKMLIRSHNRPRGVPMMIINSLLVSALMDMMGYPPTRTNFKIRARTIKPLCKCSVKQIKTGNTSNYIKSNINSRKSICGCNKHSGSTKMMKQSKTGTKCTCRAKCKKVVQVVRSQSDKETKYTAQCTAKSLNLEKGEIGICCRCCNGQKCSSKLKTFTPLN